MQTTLAEVVTLGVKAGVEPIELWQAARYGASGATKEKRRYAEWKRR